MPIEDSKILEFNQYQKSGKAPFINYEDLDPEIEKIDGCKINHEYSSTLWAKWANIFDQVFKFLPHHHLEPCKISMMYIKLKIAWKIFVCFLREHAMKIINFKIKKMKLLTKERQECKKLLYL